MSGAAASAVASLGRPASASATTTHARTDSTGVQLRWLGISGWELRFDNHCVLVDPYLTRQQYAAADGSIDLVKSLEVNAEIIEWVVAQHIDVAPEFILVTHGHWDHLADIPYLLDRPAWQDAMVRLIGGETHLNLVSAMRPDAAMTNQVLVTGGEHLRFPLRDAEHSEPDYTIEVFRSLHSQVGGYGFSPSGTVIARPAVPAVLGDLVEGGTLGYQVTVRDRLRVMFLSGSANFAEREIAGATPDVLVIGASGHAGVHDYFERALEALGWPKIVIPAHHDDLVTPLDSPEVHDSVNRDVVGVLQNVLGDRGTVLDPRHLEPIGL